MSPSARRWRPAAVAALYVATAVLVTALIVEDSRTCGRLAHPPLYDDVVYLYAGARLVRDIRAEGPGPLGRLLDYRKTHSPLSVAQSAGAMAVGGVRSVPPYIANGLFVLLWLAAVHRFARPLPLGLRVALTLFSATWPAVDRKSVV